MHKPKLTFFIELPAEELAALFDNPVVIEHLKTWMPP